MEQYTFLDQKKLMQTKEPEILADKTFEALTIYVALEKQHKYEFQHLNKLSNCTRASRILSVVRTSGLVAGWSPRTLRLENKFR